MPDPLTVGLVLQGVSLGAKTLGGFFGHQDQKDFLKKEEKKRKRARLSQALSKGKFGSYEPGTFQPGRLARGLNLAGDLAGVGSLIAGGKHQINRAKVTEQMADIGLENAQKKSDILSAQVEDLPAHMEHLKALRGIEKLKLQREGALQSGAANEAVRQLSEPVTRSTPGVSSPQRGFQMPEVDVTAKAPEAPDSLASFAALGGLQLKQESALTGAKLAATHANIVANEARTARDILTALGGNTDLQAHQAQVARMGQIVAKDFGSFESVEPKHQISVLGWLVDNGYDTTPVTGRKLSEKNIEAISQLRALQEDFAGYEDQFQKFQDIFGVVEIKALIPGSEADQHRTAMTVLLDGFKLTYAKMKLTGVLSDPDIERIEKLVPKVGGVVKNQLAKFAPLHYELNSMLQSKVGGFESAGFYVPSGTSTLGRLESGKERR